MPSPTSAAFAGAAAAFAAASCCLLMALKWAGASEEQTPDMTRPQPKMKLFRKANANDSDNFHLHKKAHDEASSHHLSTPFFTH